MNTDKLLAGSRFYKGDLSPLENEAVTLLREKKITVATAESCTGGLLSQRITNVSGASEIFHCGIISYANEIKEKLLFVEKDMLKKYGAVSAVVACEMARGAMHRAQSDISLGITGIAGPGSDGTDKPVGLVYVALYDGEKVQVREIRSDFSGDEVRDYNRYLSSSVALEMIIDYVKHGCRQTSGQSAEDFISQFHC
ncbi:MAG: nicotinamide-nucleotide amidohydrolase family protein [Clostridia bacterium]|nr:nicotinamide-nucleotide amidohydrolase family protein [Clostridia bacterium]